MTKDMSTSRRVACALAATVRLSGPAMRMKVVGTVADEDTVMMWDPSEPTVVVTWGGFSTELTPRKPAGKFALKMLLAARSACRSEERRVGKECRCVWTSGQSHQS